VSVAPALRPLLALPALAVTGFVLLACGSAGKHAAGPGTSSAATIVTTGRHALGDYDNDDYEAGRSDGDDDDDASGPTDGDGDSDNRTHSRYDRDDSSVLAFGHAASSVERREIAALVKRYYAMSAARNGAGACTLLSATVKRLLRDPAAQHYDSGRTCGQVMTKIFAMNPNELRVIAATVRVTAVRIAHAEAFAVLAFAAQPPHWMLVVRERGGWKIGFIHERELA
jgi:hypothetical protein